ncbi:hypothetical protein [Leptolyngbya sp. FACHB-261]|uniref:hypothetical protein n=1 Tax=Leptolyngbya sp. FACHB-261 TaxID=2692806 RepID=UPI001689895A|nr:hypothetical protein [Leptolyngbya sp. FACHB-261]MBD2104599.1 hypothetical protein [Leptolyngbya sp. FACHB-261]
MRGWICWSVVSLVACARPVVTSAPSPTVPLPSTVTPSASPSLAPTPSAVAPTPTSSLSRSSSVQLKKEVVEPSLARLQGQLSYPSEYIPNGVIRAENRFTNQVFKVPFEFEGNGAHRFQLQVPPGSYSVVFCGDDQLPVEALKDLPPEQAEANVEVKAGQAIDLGTLVPYNWPECR